MKKFRCTVCGYVYEGDAAPEKCPLCKAPASKFVEVVEVEGGALTFADEHVIGVAKGCDEEMIKDLNNHFMGECTEVGMYLAAAFGCRPHHCGRNLYGGSMAGKAVFLPCKPRDEDRPGGRCRPAPQRGGGQRIPGAY